MMRGKDIIPNICSVIDKILSGIIDFIESMFDLPLELISAFFAIIWMLIGVIFLIKTLLL